MTSATTCPTPAILEELLLGKLPAEPSRKLAAHLESCLHCQARAQSLATDDALVDLVRDDWQATSAMAQRVPPGLLDKVKTLGPAGSATAHISAQSPEELRGPRPSTPGKSLEDWLPQNQRTISFVQIIGIGAQIADSLSDIHARGLVYRVLCPDNVWLEYDQRISPLDPFTSHSFCVKILDVEFSREQTSESTISGTPAYMAPEQARGETVDYRCDLFSLGSILYRMCTGRPPFDGQDALATLIAVASIQPRAPRELNPAVPAALSELVMKLLRKAPAERPRSAQVVAATLRSMGDGNGPNRRRRITVAVIVALLLGAAAIVAGALWSTP